MKSLDERFDSGIWVPQGQGAQLVHLRCGLLRRPIQGARWKIRGVENLEAIGDEPVVYVSNHVSYADPCVHWCALYGQRRFMRILARDTLFRPSSPSSSPVSGRFRSIPIPPTARPSSVPRHVSTSAARRPHLPRGTRMNKPEKVYHPHAGAVLIANMGHARIVPIGISGTERIMPYGKPRSSAFPASTSTWKAIDPM